MKNNSTTYSPIIIGIKPHPLYFRKISYALNRAISLQKDEFRHNGLTKKSNGITIGLDNSGLFPTESSIKNYLFSKGINPRISNFLSKQFSPKLILTNPSELEQEGNHQDVFGFLKLQTIGSGARLVNLDTLSVPKIKLIRIHNYAKKLQKNQKLLMSKYSQETLEDEFNKLNDKPILSNLLVSASTYKKRLSLIESRIMKTNPQILVLDSDFASHLAKKLKVPVLLIPSKLPTPSQFNLNLMNKVSKMRKMPFFKNMNK